MADGLSLKPFCAGTKITLIKEDQRRTKITLKESWNIQEVEERDPAATKNIKDKRIFRTPLRAPRNFEI